METIFPSDTGYDSLFIVSVRKDNAQQTQQTGTVIVKRTYTIQPTTGVTTPTALSLPVFMVDQPDNLVGNSDFATVSGDEKKLLSDWQIDPKIITSQTPDGNIFWLQAQGIARGRIVQTITLEQPLGGRQFTLSFSAKTTENQHARIEAVQLEVENSPPLCVINTNLTDNITRFNATGQWPAEVEATTMNVVLRTATEATKSVEYTQIQVEERGELTEWNPKTTLYYENDLAAFKPEGDLIVLNFATVSQAVTRQATVNGTTWLEHHLKAVSARPKALFGWEPRVDEFRKKDAGTFPDEADQYPLVDPLPADFNNRFYNGYRRTFPVDNEQKIIAHTPFPYFPTAAQIKIWQDSTIIYQLQLPNEILSATYYAHRDGGIDEPSNWYQQSIDLNLDTLVIEPELNRCYLVWRGVWPFDEQPEANYRRLVVTDLNQEVKHV